VRNRTDFFRRFGKIEVAWRWEEWIAETTEGKPMKPSLSQAILLLSKSAVLLIFGILVVLLLIKNPDAVVELAERTQTVEIGNTKIEFGEKAFVLNQDLRKLDIGAQRKIRQLVKSLSSQEADRLLHLPEYDKDHLSDADLHCDYDNASSRMRLYAAADQGLIEKSFVERIPRPQLTKGLQEELAKKERMNIPSENGHPSNCYQMALTKDGSDVKSVIISELTRAFGDASEPTAERTPEKPSAKKSQEQLSRARYPKSAALISGQ
jgi:hypothetical protein